MVKAIVKCTAVEGMKTSWYIEAYDEKDLIGKGTHDRFTINVDKFNQKLEKKIS
jgi:fluoroacetyl-CoA thioesterase